MKKLILTLGLAMFSFGAIAAPYQVKSFTEYKGGKKIVCYYVVTAGKITALSCVKL